MENTSYIALTLTAVAFLALGAYFVIRIRGITDFLPVARSGRARVRSSGAFSASTVATSISLATIIAAYFSLARDLGLWLLWTGCTASIGMWAVYFFSPYISKKLEAYSFVPSIHEFLAQEYSCAALKPTAAIFTVIGLLLLLATELLVGSSFLATIIPGASTLALTLALSAVPVIYVMCGGFETVIISDRIQMAFIWIMIPALFAAVTFSEGATFHDIISTVRFEPVNSGIFWFLLGIALMNIPTHLSSITVWQRVSASVDKRVLQKGLLFSSIGIFLSWSLLVIAAWAACRVIRNGSGIEVLQQLLIRCSSGALGKCLVFIIITGLYSALLSTASTFLIATGHTFTTDIFGWENHEASGTFKAAGSLNFSRATIIVTASAACSIVAVLNHFGYRIEDIIFSIYGGALSLFPPMVFALLKPREWLSRLSRYALWSISFGFLSGWTVAILGKCFDLRNLIFMSPAVGMAGSMAVLLFGIWRKRHVQH